MGNPLLNTDIVKARLKAWNITLLGDFIETRIPIRCQCDLCGHAWNVRLGDLKRQGCGGCHDKARAKAQADRVVAHAKSKCISVLESYVNSTIPFKCLCDVCGYEWKAYWGNVLRKGCPQCSWKSGGVRRRTPESEVLEALKLNGIKLLSPYEGTQHKHDLQCVKCDTRWRPVLSSVIKNAASGCPTCARETMGMPLRDSQYVSEILASKKLELLTPYAGTTAMHTVRCLTCGLTRTVQFGSITSGNGCPKCSGVLKRTEADYAALASSFGGECLKMAKNTYSKSEWRCRFGHIFSKKFTVIQRDNAFCSTCSSYLSERLCRAVLEAMYARPFPKVRIPALSIRGKKLELDGYCESLKIAFEHNGAHHYRPTTYGTRQASESVKAHERMAKNDILRHAWCAENGVTLVIVRELGYATKAENLAETMLLALKDCPNQPINLDVDVLKLAQNLPPEDLVLWNKITALATDSGLSLLEATYLGATHLYTFTCASGHAFRRSAWSIRNDTRCPVCTGSRQFLARRHPEAYAALKASEDPAIAAAKAEAERVQHNAKARAKHALLSKEERRQLRLKYPPIDKAKAEARELRKYVNRRAKYALMTVEEKRKRRLKYRHALISSSPSPATPPSSPSPCRASSLPDSPTLPRSLQIPPHPSPPSACTPSVPTQ